MADAALGSDRIDACARRALAPLDVLRAALLRLLGAAYRPLIVRPELRHAVLGGAGIAVAFVLTALAPEALLLLGPILLGVPHLLADLRYLVARRGLTQRPLVCVAVLAPLALVFVLPALTVAGICTIGVALAARTRPASRVVAVVVGAACIALDHAFGFVAAVVFAHVHNVLSLGLWWCMRARRSLWEPVPVLVAVGGAAAIALGALDGALLSPFPLGEPAMASLEAVYASLSPVVAPVASTRWVLLFAFGQAVHYVVWLRMMPDDLRGRPAPRPFVASFRALRGELGSALLLAAIGAALFVLAWAALDLSAARTGYLHLALFHGPLEVACAALAAAERRRP